MTARQLDCFCYTVITPLLSTLNTDWKKMTLLTRRNSSTDVMAAERQCLYLCQSPCVAFANQQCGVPDYTCCVMALQSKQAAPQLRAEVQMAEGFVLLECPWQWKNRGKPGESPLSLFSQRYTVAMGRLNEMSTCTGFGFVFDGIILQHLWFILWISLLFMVHLYLQAVSLAKHRDLMKFSSQSRNSQFSYCMA